MAEHRLHLLLSTLIACEIEKHMFCKFYIYIVYFNCLKWFVIFLEDHSERMRSKGRSSEWVNFCLVIRMFVSLWHFPNITRLPRALVFSSWAIFTALMNTSMGLLNGLWFSQCLNQLIHKGPFESVSFYDCVKFKGFQVHKMQRNENQG